MQQANSFTLMKFQMVTNVAVSAQHAVSVQK